jgi:hypothetical protein
MISDDIDRLLWWAIDGVLAGMPMPYVSPERRMNLGGKLSAYVDELPLLHLAGIRAVVCLLNASSFSVARSDLDLLPPWNKRRRSLSSLTYAASRGFRLRCIAKAVWVGLERLLPLT